MSRHDRYERFEFAQEEPKRRLWIPWKWLAALALVAGLAAYVWKFEQPRIERVLDGTPLELEAAPPRPVYRWRDASGSWNITDRRPPAGVPYETVDGEF